MTNHPKPVRLKPEDIAQAVRVVEHAFAQYAYMQYVAPSDADRVSVAAWFARACVRYGMLYGQVYTTPGLNGVAVWLLPGQTHLAVWRLLCSGFTALPIRVGAHGLLRMIQSSWHMEREHELYACGPHWYLFALSVEPAQQGHGIGGGLMRPVLEQADRDGQPCYLETHTERNARFYVRHGFKVMSTVRMPGSDMTIWALLRPPASTGL